MTTDTGCLISYLEIRGKRTTVRVGGLKLYQTRTTPPRATYVEQARPPQGGHSLEEG